MAPVISIYSGFDWVNDVDLYETLIFRRKWQDIGDFQINIPFTDGIEDSIKMGHIICLDGDPHRAGRITYIDRSEDDSAYIVRGYTLNGIVSERTNQQFDNDQMNDWNMGDDVMPPSTGPGQYSTLPAEDVIKKYIDRHIVNPSDPERKISNFTIAPSNHRGVQLLKIAKNGTPLNQTINEVCVFSDLGYEIQFVTGSQAGFVFDIIPGRDRGLYDDRDSLNHIEFSSDFDNIKGIHIIEDETGYKNVGYAAGKRYENGSRVLTPVYTSEYIPSGMDRHEVFLDCGDNLTSVESDTAKSLYDEGMQRMKEYQKIETIDGTALNIGTYKYGEDFDLGDIVAVKSVKFGYVENKRISEIAETYDKNSPNGDIQISFGFAKQSLRNTIKKIAREASL